MASKVKILLVEDDNLLVRMYQDKLESDGYEVAVSEDGEQGLKACKKDKPDLVLLDIMMPKVNGFEMLKQMKEDKGLKTIPVVLLTNLGGKDDAQRGLEMGAVAYLIKSDYTPDEIIKKIKEILHASTRDKEKVPEAVEIDKDEKEEDKK